MRTALPSRLVVDSPPALSRIVKMPAASDAVRIPSTMLRATAPSRSSLGSVDGRRHLVGDPGLDLVTAGCEFTSSSSVSVDPTNLVMCTAERQSSSRLLSRNPMSRLIIVIGTTLPMALMNSIVPALQGTGHQPVCEVADLRIERLHALRHQFGKDGPAMDLVQRRIRRGQRLTAGVPEREPARQSVVVAIEQALHVRREIRDPSACLDQELERADDEDVGPGYLPNRGVFPQPSVEGVRVTEHLRVQQQRSGDLLVHLVLSSANPRRERPIRSQSPTRVILSYGILEITDGASKRDE